METKYLAVVSQKAGNYHPEACSWLKEAFACKGVELDFVYYGREVVDCRGRLRKAIDSGLCNIIAVGGDGTISLVASELYGKPHRLGIIPLGTANTLARLLKIPISTREAIQVVADSKQTKAIDGMEVDGRIFLMNVSLGISSISLEGVNDQMKSTLKVASYLVGTAKGAPRFVPRAYRMQIDNNPVHVRTVELHVTNTGVLGLPRYRVYENSKLDDGKLEVLVLRQATPWGILNAFLDLMRKQKYEIKLLGQGSEIVIESPEPMVVQADGDIIKQTPVHIRVRPAAINFIVPAQ
jgi:diacylglycerol kinase (ATP)